MNIDFLASIDAGTGSIRALVYNIKSKKIVFSQDEWLYQPDPKGPEGSLLFNPDDFFQKSIKVFIEALKKSDLPGNPVGAITFTSMRDGVIFLDQNKKEIYCGPNIDSRIMADTWPSENDNRNTYLKSGRWIIPLFLSYRLQWFKTCRPEIFTKIKTVLSMTDWFSFKYCGECYSEPTNSGETGLFDVQKRDWNYELINEFQFPEGIFPKVIECGTKIGNITKIVADLIGISEKTTMITGGADTQFACLGSGAYIPGDLTIVAGTWGPIQLITEKPKFDKEMRTWTGCSVIPGTWSLESTSMMIGLVHRWIMDTMYSGLSDPYDIMENEAVSVLMSDPNLFSYVGVGLMDAKKLELVPNGAIIIPSIYCLTRQMRRGHFTHAAYMSTCFSAAYNFEQIEKINPQIKNIHLCGGVSRSNIWVEMITNTIGREIVLPEFPEATGLGGIIAAGVGTGIWDWEEGTQIIVKTKSKFPDMKKTKQYSELFKKWKDNYSAVVEMRNKLS